MGSSSAKLPCEAVSKEMELVQAALAPYKRPANILLADSPLPKTAIRKVARERLDIKHDFRLDCWLQSGASGPEEEVQA